MTIENWVKDQTKNNAMKEKAVNKENPPLPSLPLFKAGETVWMKLKVVDRAPWQSNGVFIRTENAMHTFLITGDGKLDPADNERSVFHQFEMAQQVIRTSPFPPKKYEIGQKLNGFTEVMQALLDGQFVKAGTSDTIRRKSSTGEIQNWIQEDKYWHKSDQTLNAMELFQGRIVADPTPKRIIAYRSSTGDIILSDLVDTANVYNDHDILTKAELNEYLERM